MSYEFEEYIRDEILSNINHMNILDDALDELDHVYAQAAKADEYEAKNKELLEELKYLKKVNNDLVWQRDTDEEHEAKAKAYNDTLKTLDKLINNDERYKGARSNDFIGGMLIGYKNIFNLMEDYIKESGEMDAKK